MLKFIRDRHYHRHSLLMVLMIAVTIVGAAEGSVASQSANESSGASTEWSVRARSSTTDSDRRAYEAISRLHLRNYQSEAFRGTWFHACVNLGTDPADPHAVLCAMGVDAVPALASVLHDRSATNTVTSYGKTRPGEKKIWRLGELAARILAIACGRDFKVGSGEQQSSLLYMADNPEQVAELQRLVMEWYETNRQSSDIELRIRALDDGDMPNRLQAAEWLAGRRIIASAGAIERALERALARKVRSSLDDTEIAVLAGALGRIGSESSLAAVRLAVDHHDGLFERHFREPGRRRDLFLCYGALAALGQRAEALSRLEVIYTAKQSEFDDHARDMFRRELERARAW